MIPEQTIIIPKTECRITGDFRVDRLVEYVRKHDFPKWNEQPIQFANEKNYALCSELSGEMSSTIDAVEMGLYDDEKQLVQNKHFDRFDGGWFIRQGKTWNVYVDGHYYFFDF